MEELIKKYKDIAFDPKQPFAVEVYHLYKTYPNDKELGEQVRKLMLRMEAHLKQKAVEKNTEDLKRIIESGK
jgi:hypothetical protein